MQPWREGWPYNNRKKMISEPFKMILTVANLISSVKGCHIYNRKDISRESFPNNIKVVTLILNRKDIFSESFPICLVSLAVPNSDSLQAVYQRERWRLARCVRIFAMEIYLPTYTLFANIIYLLIFNRDEIFF